MSSAIIAIDEKIGHDKNGTVFYKDESGEWHNIAKLEALSLQTMLNEMIRERFQMKNENDIVQIRLFEGQLMWLTSNVHGGGVSWEPVCPDLVALNSLDGTLTPTEPVAPKEEKLKMGWYQDIKGDLYQFDGNTWLGAVPSKNQQKTLEYLG